MNASYVMGAKLTEAFNDTGWCTRIRGAEFGGRVEGLPCHTFITDEGDVDLKCPTEIGIPDTREKELSDLGFLSLGHYKNTDYAVFFGAQTVQRPKQYDDPDATANAAISARLPYIMAVSRISHYLKVIARDKIGSPMDVPNCERWLNNWIGSYILADPNASADKKAKFPLAAAKVSVEEVEGSPGSFQAVALLQPWLGMEELSASMRLVARIPERS
jgi:type VI secretion system protein ImpC